MALNGLINDQDKADILLVLSGFKPAAMFELSYFKDKTFSKAEFLKKVMSLKKILQKLRMAYVIHINYPENLNEITQFTLLAKDQKTLKKLTSAALMKNFRKHPQTSENGLTAWDKAILLQVKIRIAV